MEKPFGKDLGSSRELQKALEPDWKEEEIFRIDHYLGKEMVKNILILRFGNEFLSATWNRNHIDNVQVIFFFFFSPFLPIIVFALPTEWRDVIGQAER